MTKLLLRHDTKQPREATQQFYAVTVSLMSLKSGFLKGVFL